MPQKKPSKSKTAPDFHKIFQLAEHHSAASDILAEQAKSPEWGASAPQLLVDSFAAELYLKCLYVMDTNEEPRKEHDLKKLFDGLAPYTKTAIREAFERSIKSHPVLSNLHLINPNAVKVTDFDRSLKAASRTFDLRRYIFEPPPPGEWFYAHLLREAFRTVAKMDLRLAVPAPTTAKSE